MNRDLAADVITEASVAALLSALVAIPSINPAFRQDEPAAWFGEARLAQYVGDWLARAGAEVTYEEVEPERPNVVARLGRGRGPRMIWEGHLDTVQVTASMIEPFKPILQDGRLYGRGAVDDKGCLAMFMLAMQVLARESCPIDLTFLAAVDEEVSFKGISHHVARNPPYDLGIAGEPTKLEIITACKGVIRWHVTIRGKAAHTATPEDGIDAIAIAIRLVDVLRSAVDCAGRAHPRLGRPSLTCTRFAAGEGLNTVPSQAELTFDYRILPAQTGPQAWAELRAVTQHFAETLPAEAVIEMHPPFIDSASMDVADDSRIVRLLQNVCRDFDRTPTLLGVPFGSDATKLTRAGSPTIVFGPGSIAQAHTADEFVSLAEVAEGARMLVAAVRKLA